MLTYDLAADRLTLHLSTPGKATRLEVLDCYPGLKIEIDQHGTLFCVHLDAASDMLKGRLRPSQLANAAQQMRALVGELSLLALELRETATPDAGQDVARERWRIADLIAAKIQPVEAIRDTLPEDHSDWDISRKELDL